METHTHCEVSNLSSERVYDGFLKMDRYALNHEMFNGEKTETITREVLERGNSVAVLPYDPRTDKVMLIQQFLIGAHVAGADNRPLQVIAGGVERGQTPEDTAFREADEEAGCSIKKLIPAHNFLPSPGGTSEFIYTYLGIADLDDGGEIHGLDEENEDILNHVVSATEAIEMLDNGQITSGLAVVLMSWFARHRDAIRAEYNVEKQKPKTTKKKKISGEEDIMFDQHPHITKDRLSELFPSGMLPYSAMKVLADDTLTKDQVHTKLETIAGNS